MIPFKQLIILGLGGFALIWVGLLSLIGGGDAAGDAAPPRDDGSVIAEITQFDNNDFHIGMSMKVTDKQKETIGGLQKTDFEVREDGELVNLTSFATAGQQPIRACLVIDHSGSMEGAKLEGAKDAALAFLDLMRDDVDYLGLIFFETHVREIISTKVLTSKRRQEARSEIRSLRTAGGTAMYDAMEEGLDAMEDVTGRRIMLVLTDGMDNDQSVAQRDRIIERAQKLKIPLMMVGLGPRSDIDEEALEQFAKETKGQYLRTPDPSELKKIYGKIGEALQQEYRLEYDSPNPVNDGLTRKIHITVRNGEVGTVAREEYTPSGVISTGGAKRAKGEEAPESEVSFAVVFFPLLLILGGLLAYPFLRELLPRKGAAGSSPPAASAPSPSVPPQVPPRPASPPPPTKAVPPPARTPATPQGTSPAGDTCCGMKAFGRPGERACIICGRRF